MGRLHLIIGDPATLIIIDFQFTTGKASRRFRSATVTIRFSGIETTVDPEVVNISPKGHFSIEPTSRQVSLAQSANLSVNGGGAGLSSNAGLGWELTESSNQQPDHLIWNHQVGTAQSWSEEYSSLGPTREQE
jgi:hypothetical protein